MQHHSGAWPSSKLCEQSQKPAQCGRAMPLRLLHTYSGWQWSARSFASADTGELLPVLALLCQINSVRGGAARAEVLFECPVRNRRRHLCGCVTQAVCCKSNERA